MIGRMRTIETYGGAYTDAAVVENPEIEQGADLYNRHAEDTAILTCVAPAWHVTFTLTNTAAPTTVAIGNISVRGPGGNGNDMKPTINKTATGAYEVVFPSSYTDSLGEEVLTSLMGATAQLISATDGKATVVSIVSGGVGIVVRNAAGAAADLTGSVYIGAA